MSPRFNNLVGWTDALGNTTSFSYDPSGNPQSTTYPDGTIEQFTFDAQGNLVRTVNRRGQSVSYTYDANGLVTRKDLPDGTHVDYTYDARRNLLSATGATGATTMEYDLADRMTKITYPGGQFLQFTYDAGGRRTQAIDQSGFTDQLQLRRGRPAAQLTDGSAQPIVTYEYDAAGRLIRETDGNGTSTTYDYDAANQLLHLVNFAPDGTTILSRFDYTYDANGRTHQHDDARRDDRLRVRRRRTADPGGRCLADGFSRTLTTPRATEPLTSDNGATHGLHRQRHEPVRGGRRDQPEFRRGREPDLQFRPERTPQL